MNESQGPATRRARRLQKLEEEDGPLLCLKGAPEPEVLYLYVTFCHIDTSPKHLERLILTEYPNVSEARIRSTKRSHDFYASFTVMVKGDGLELEDFTNNSEAFPRPIKVFPNRNKYRDEQHV